MNLRTVLVAASALSLLAACSSPDAGRVEAKAPVYGTFGFDAAGMDRAVRPGDDFFGFANGGWVRTTEIPADRSVWNTFGVLAEGLVAQVTLRVM